MNENEQKKISELLEDCLNENLCQIVLSNSTDKEKMEKARLRPLLLRGHLTFQSEELSGKQAFHKNMEKEETILYVQSLLSGQFKQGDISSSEGNAHILVSKKGTVTIKIKKNEQPKQTAADQVLTHNRKKHYILEEGVQVPFLEDLGILTAKGQVIRTKYDKYKQINRFLEFIEDILPKLDKEKVNTIIDFGCGKSYLTFAMYYYLKELKNYPVRIIGLDLKQDVIDKCNQLCERYGFENMKFYYGNIENYEGVSQVDMVVTLHACDTATDFAINKAIRWGARVILSVPCCQHELNKQMNNDLMNTVFQYGLIKEKMASLYTDAIRAQILENQGYRTQILEFIDMEHTPKNILIRAVKQGPKKDNQKELEALMNFLHVEPTLWRLCEKNIR